MSTHLSRTPKRATTPSIRLGDKTKGWTPKSAGGGRTGAPYVSGESGKSAFARSHWGSLRMFPQKSSREADACPFPRGGVPLSSVSSSVSPFLALAAPGPIHGRLPSPAQAGWEDEGGIAWRCRFLPSLAEALLPYRVTSWEPSSGRARESPFTSAETLVSVPGWTAGRDGAPGLSSPRTRLSSHRGLWGGGQRGVADSRPPVGAEQHPARLWQ